MTDKRISYIDMAKGIGIILVVLGHSIFPSENLTTWIYSFHMPLFFILSGMLLSHTHATEQALTSFIRKKAQAIFIPYFAFSVLTILFSALLDTASFGSYLPFALLSTISFCGLSVLWFLPALFFGEVLFLFIRKHTSLLGSALIVLCICLLTVFSANTYHYHYETDFDSYLSVLGAFLIAVFVRTGIATTFLAFGYYLYHFFFVKDIKRHICLMLSVLFLALNLFLAFKNESVDLNNLIFHNYLLYFSAALSGSLAVICFCAALPEIKPLGMIGKESFIIMVTHMNCRFLGICYAAGNLALSTLPLLGKTGYFLITASCMILLEAITICVIHRYAPFLIGEKRK